MRVCIICAYSSANRGDGLLLRLTQELLLEVVPSGLHLEVIALDASSFDQVSGTVVEWPEHFLSRSARRWLPGSVKKATVISPVAIRRLEDYVGSFDAVVAVGGAPLRVDRLVRLRSLLAHAPQIYAARRAPISIVMPQSIGPFPSPPLSTIAIRLLQRLDHIYARDDRTLRDLSALQNISRLPDLAVLDLAQSHENHRTQGCGTEQYLLIPRSLGRDSYDGSIIELAGLLPNLTTFVQSEARNNNDAEIVRRVASSRTIGEIADFVPGVAISVRLHGALACIAAGIPTIHLAYERKGFGAFQDLGIPAWCQSVYSFSPNGVREQAERLLEDPSDYWEAIDGKLTGLRAQRAELRADLERRLRVE
ncbi:MAG: hypothetical protein JWM34_4656 [Ilumatobacteraceae bacterium]|nr:hypothetical protein [Ilumatobacteraceae bacterium]